MGQRIFDILAAVSLLLCLATCVLWGRSYWVQPPPATYSDRWMYSAGYAAIGKGEGTFVYYDTAPGPARWFQCVTLNARPLRISQWMGGSGWNSTWWYTSVDVQLWVLCMIFALLPAAWLLGALFRRQRMTGLRCVTCGYDLRASPERCPECGAVPSTATPATSSPSR